MAKLLGRRSIPAEKIGAYLLNPNHPRGGAKEKFYRSFGFERSEGEILAAALHRHAETRDVVSEEITAFGVKTVVRCSLDTPDGRNPCVLSVWVREPSTDIQRFVTAYPA